VSIKPAAAQTSRGVHSLTHSDCAEIVEHLIEKLTELELSLAREVANNQKLQEHEA
jgi:hypothetical protein